MHELIGGWLGWECGVYCWAQGAGANSKYSSAVESNKVLELLVNHNFPLRYLQVYLLLTLASYSHKTKAQLASAH